MGGASPERLFISPVGDLISLDGRELYRRQTDDSRITRAVESLPDVHPLLLLLPAPLHLPGIPALRKRLGPGDTLVPLEADPVLSELTASELPGLRARLPEQQVVPVLGVSPDSSGSAVSRLADSILGQLDAIPRRLSVLRLGRAYRLHAGLYRRVEGALIAALQRQWQNRATLSAVGALVRRNVPVNLAHANLCAPFAGGGGRRAPEDLTAPEGIALVLGAGPSLDRLPQHSQVLSEASRVLVADSAWLALARGGPELHRVAARAELVITEPRLANLADFHRTMWVHSQVAAVDRGHPSDGAPGVPRVLRAPLAWMDLAAHPSGLRQAADRVGLFFCGIPDSAWSERIRRAFPELTGPPTRGSVGVTALEIALQSGLTELAVLGLDFLSLPGRSHARGSAPHRNLLGRHSRLQPTASGPVYGRTWIRTEGSWPNLVLSSPVLDDYARSARELLRESGVTLHDLRGFGRPLAEARWSPGPRTDPARTTSGAHPERSAFGSVRAKGFPRQMSASRSYQRTPPEPIPLADDPRAWHRRVQDWLSQERDMLLRFIHDPADSGLMRELDQLSWGLAQDTPGTRRLVAIREERRLGSILLGLEHREEG